MAVWLGFLAVALPTLVLLVKVAHIPRLAAQALIICVGAPLSYLIQRRWTFGSSEPPVAEAFARHGVSIQAVRQTSRGTEALLVIVTHVARDADLAATISELQALPVVRAVASVMRVEGEEDQ